jgi:hypothetical protein
LDRYLRLGAIMFNPDGTLANIPFGIPLYEFFTLQQYTYAQTQKTFPENLLCQRIGETLADVASNVSPPSVSTPTVFPLMSSVGFVVYDNDVYLNQHATMQVNVSGTATPIGDGNQFTDMDMNYALYTNAYPSGVPQPIAQDKFIEESWIDQNGTAFLVSPVNGSLIKAK